MKSEERIRFEDIHEGDEIPTLRVKMDKETYLNYSKMVNEINPLHFDEDYAKSLGFRTIVVAGVYTYSFLPKMLTDWLKNPECVKNIEIRYISPIYIEDEIVNKGVVKRKYLQNGEKIVECEVWVENQEGEKVTEGKARIIIRLGLKGSMKHSTK
ncbi:MAG: MaoC family dehydratase [Candidatus Lokiarchaeia archaeon]